MKIGVGISIDLDKIEEGRIIQGKKGRYLDLTAFIDTENTDEYDQNGTIKQKTSKEERDRGTQLPILGGCKVFYKEENN